MVQEASFPCQPEASHYYLHWTTVSAVLTAHALGVIRQFSFSVHPLIFGVKDHTP